VVVRLRALAPSRAAALIVVAAVACATGPTPRLPETGNDDGGARHPTPEAIAADTDPDPDPDTDGDGIPDRRDRCPDVPEDKDNFEDDDGCPDPDNDRDGIPDVDDKCPNEPETFNNRDDDDGCPDEGLAWRSAQIGFVDIPFARGHSAVELGSVTLVDQIAAFLAQRCASLELQGHASDDEPRPRALAAARAAAVRSALIARGVRAGGLKVRSFGVTQPVCRPDGELCREKNRCVAIKVLDLRICK
jgi:OOP family OmpA-OmpF porin